MVELAAERRAQIATRVMFFVAGFGMAAWAPLVPFAKARAGIDDGMLGLLLLCLGLGSMPAMPLAGALAARFGCRSVMLLGTVLLCLPLPLLASASDFLVLAAALTVFGIGLGAIDVAMNLQAIIVERASGRAMMSGFHGCFSLGGMLGAAGVAGLLVLGASPLAATFGVLLVIAGLALLAAPHLLRAGSGRAGPVFVRPRGVVLLLGLLCAVAFLAEGAVLDWSAVYLSAAGGLPANSAGLGYAAFSLAMVAARFTGDALVSRLGGRCVIAVGGLCAAAGLALAVLVPAWPAALLGFALVGLGCANIVPVLFTAVGRQRVMPESLALPAVTTLGYAGLLAGPAMIGFIAQASGLATALVLLAALLLGVAASGARLRV